MVVRRVTQEAEGVRSFRFEHVAGEDLAPWEPGAHLDITLPSGRVRQYSLCGDPADRSGYVVAVLDQPQGRGGSREIHRAVTSGVELEVRGPRNHFPLVEAESYLFIAGGIGITPILPMIRAVAAAGRPWRLVYGGRSPASMAFVREIEAFGGDVAFVPERSHGLIDVKAELARCRSRTNVYCCGPEPLLRAVAAACEQCDAVRALHVERFASSHLADDPVSASDGAERGRSAASAAARSFEVELAATGKTLVVEPGASILDRVLEVVPDWPWACREGYCGTCETAVISGTPEHHDDVLTDEEREAGDVMMICVGRSCSPSLVLDI